MKKAITAGMKTTTKTTKTTTINSVVMTYGEINDNNDDHGDVESNINVKKQGTTTIGQ